MSHEMANQPDAVAWSAFTELVARGAGTRDVVDRRAVDAHPNAATARDVAYLLGLVEHHARNTIPFLIDGCALAGKHALEIGSGTGALAVAMAEAGVARVEGVEPIAENHEAGLLRLRAHRLEHRVRLRHHHDAGALPFADGSFDAAIASSVLQYVPGRERKRLLAEMHRVTRNGGLVIVCGSGNALYPGGPHSVTWWSNWMPELAERTDTQRAVGVFEVRRVLEPLGAEIVRARGGAERFARRMRERESSGLRALAARAGIAAVTLAERVLERTGGMPVEALLPYLAVAFRKTPRRG